MTAIRIHKQIDSETLHLPELKPFVGRRVEIIIMEEETAPVTAKEEAWKAFFAQHGCDLVDPEVYRAQREYDQLHQQPPEL